MCSLQRTEGHFRILQLLLLAYFLLHGTVYAQEFEVLNRLEIQPDPVIEYKPDTTRILEMLKGGETLEFTHPDSALLLAGKALRETRQTDYKTGQLRALFLMGNLRSAEGAHHQSIFFYKQALALAREIIETHPRHDKVIIIRILNNLGRNYKAMGYYHQAIYYYSMGINAVESTHLKDSKDERAAMLLFNNVGALWNDLKEPKLAGYYLGKGRILAEKSKDSFVLAGIYCNIASLETTDKEKGRDYFEKALLIGNKNNYPLIQISATQGLGIYWDNEGQPEKAISYFKESLKHTKKSRNTEKKFVLYYNLAITYLNIRDHRMAEKYLKTSLENTSGIKADYDIALIHRGLSTVYAHTGRHRQAWGHIAMYIKMNDSMMKAEKRRVISTFEQYHIAEKDKQLALRKLQILEQEKRLQKKNLLILGISAGVAVMIVLLFSFHRNYKHKQRLQKERFRGIEQEQEIIQLKAMIRGEEKERARLARELHDGVTSQLVAVKLNVGNLRNRKDRMITPEELDNVFLQLDETTKELRKAAHNLLPDTLEESGLEIASGLFCEKIKTGTGIDTDFQVYGIIPRLHHEIELSLYRMIQELTQNVLKHASATYLMVQLSCRDQLLSITVEDNGRGLPADNIPGDVGKGLRAIEERVLSLNGHVDVISKEHTGTTIYIEFDISKFQNSSHVY